jgi:hypothetical protein
MLRLRCLRQLYVLNTSTYVSVYVIRMYKYVFVYGCMDAYVYVCIRTCTSLHSICMYTHVYEFAQCTMLISTLNSQQLESTMRSESDASAVFGGTNWYHKMIWVASILTGVDHPVQIVYCVIRD